MREVFHSGYCFSIPSEEYRELVKEYKDKEFLKLRLDRIPAIGDLRYYDRFDRNGTILEAHHFLIEEVTDLVVHSINTTYISQDENDYKEVVDVIVEVVCKTTLFKEKSPALWEKPSAI